MSNRLGAINDFFELEKKLKQSDLSLWTAVKMNNPHAKALMRRYNIHDVLATEALFNKLIGYAKLPIGQYDDDMRHCVNCGSDKVHLYGIRNTRTSSYKRYRCSSCGSYSKGLILKPELRHES